MSLLTVLLRPGGCSLQCSKAIVGFTGSQTDLNNIFPSKMQRLLYSQQTPWRLCCSSLPLPVPAVCPLGLGWCPGRCRRSCPKSVSLPWWRTDWRVPFCLFHQWQKPSCFLHLPTPPAGERWQVKHCVAEVCNKSKPSVQELFLSH